MKRSEIFKKVFLHGDFCGRLKNNRPVLNRHDVKKDISEMNGISFFRGKITGSMLWASLYQPSIIGEKTYEMNFIFGKRRRFFECVNKWGNFVEQTALMSVSDWDSYTQLEHFSKTPEYFLGFVLKPSAKIFIIDSFEKYLFAMKKFGFENLSIGKTALELTEKKYPILNYEDIAKSYDGIFFDTEFLKYAYSTEEKDILTALSEINVSSLVIWDESAIECLFYENAETIRINAKEELIKHKEIGKNFEVFCSGRKYITVKKVNELNIRQLSTEAKNFQGELICYAKDGDSKKIYFKSEGKIFLCIQNGHNISVKELQEGISIVDEQYKVFPQKKINVKILFECFVQTKDLELPLFANFIFFDDNMMFADFFPTGSSKLDELLSSK